MKKIILSLFVLATSFGNSLAQGLTAKDSRFMEDALQAGLMEIKASELCLTNAADENVKRLGEQIVVEHTRINTELKGLAAKKNCMLPATLDEENQKKYNELAQKKGSSFDHAYAEMMVKHHQNSIASYREENVNGSDTDVRNWAAKVVPILEHHLIKANDTAATLK